MKKTLSLIIAMLLLSVSLVGCGGSRPKDGDTRNSVFKNGRSQTYRDGQWRIE